MSTRFRCWLKLHAGTSSSSCNKHSSFYCLDQYPEQGGQELPSNFFIFKTASISIPFLLERLLFPWMVPHQYHVLGPDSICWWLVEEELFCLLWWYLEKNIIPLKHWEKMIVRQEYQLFMSWISMRKLIAPQEYINIKQLPAIEQVWKSLIFRDSSNHNFPVKGFKN